MPVISSFYGLIIKMYFQQSEHQPPHIHVIYAEFSGSITIKDCRMLEGDLPKKALSLVKEWVALHRKELLDMWNTQEFREIKGL